MTKLAKYSTIQEAADFLGISVQRVGQLVKAKKLGKVVKRQVGYRSISHLTRAPLLARKKLASPDLRNGQ